MKVRELSFFNRGEIIVALLPDNTMIQAENHLLNRTGIFDPALMVENPIENRSSEFVGKMPSDYVTADFYHFYGCEKDI